MAINDYAAWCLEGEDARLKRTGIQHLNTEAFAAGAAGLRVRVAELEPAGDQAAGVVQDAALEVQGGPGVDQHLRAGGADQDIPPLGLRHEAQLVAQAVATAPRDRDPQV